MRILCLLTIAASLHFAVGGATAQPIRKFDSVTVQLPDGTAPYPAGPGVEAMNDNCLACHSAEMVLNQPPLPRATWVAEVAKMRGTYKAPVSDSDAATIVSYLAAIKGAQQAR